MSKKLENLIDQKVKLTNKLREVANQISEIEDKEKLPELRTKYEGRYFKFRNSYSCPKQESDYWFIYFKVEKVESVLKVIAKSFEIDSEGMIRIESERNTSIGLLEREITQLEYNEQLQRLLSKIDLA